MKMMPNREGIIVLLRVDVLFGLILPYQVHDFLKLQVAELLEAAAITAT
ncbi:MAG: hypothetical protein V4719_30160 [Planctomycetota bacterium]